MRLRILNGRSMARVCPAGSFGDVAASEQLDGSDGEVAQCGHVVSLGPVDAPDGVRSGPGDLERVDASPVRAFDEAASEAMVAEVVLSTVDVATGEAAVAINHAPTCAPYPQRAWSPRR